MFHVKLRDLLEKEPANPLRPKNLGSQLASHRVLGLALARHERAPQRKSQRLRSPARWLQQ